MIETNPSAHGHVRTRSSVASQSQQTCYALDHHASQKKDASIPELSNMYCLFPSVQC